MIFDIGTASNNSITSATLVTLVLIVGGLLIVYVLRYIVHFYAFNGMSKTNERKIKRSQSRLSRIFMTYATKSNPTKYYPPLGTWLSLICYYTFCFSVILFLFFLWIEIFFEYGLGIIDPFNWNPTLDFILDLMLIPLLWAPMVSTLSVLFPLRKKKKDS